MFFDFGRKVFFRIFCIFFLKFYNVQYNYFFLYKWENNDSDEMFVLILCKQCNKLF